MKQNSAEQQPGVGLYIGVCQTLAGAGWDWNSAQELSLERPFIQLHDGRKWK